jgi:hypothetical protein
MTKLNSLGDRVPDAFVEFYNDHRYRVNSWGQIFICRVIGYGNNGLKFWAFESLDTETYGQRIYVWDKSCFEKIT